MFREAWTRPSEWNKHILFEIFGLFKIVPSHTDNLDRKFSFLQLPGTVGKDEFVNVVIFPIQMSFINRIGLPFVAELALLLLQPD